MIAVKIGRMYRLTLNACRSNYIHPIRACHTLFDSFRNKLSDDITYMSRYNPVDVQTWKGGGGPP
ncbi:uncharacterized protein RHIMIDRAFT_242855 [Rhizopus microsporus ATCC 52813]|uniref:Uncharacterized protein n=1 Tax=Rhizopus microsporus ATCC 52813 TaxID=1340429 RepID=A0A2G4SEM9_RHIZD|nr:uncharacterized protein RHIMIDRAFT_242855 [Rhizopus microsporus ATCC 52813]PHZ07243.1 hypothetical protein RHIMIDRAFT_242855 [Rhizopus microsporus ATCC 52813]